VNGVEELAAGIRSENRPVAILAGSGTSHSAGLPTGQELLRSIAHSIGDDAGADPVAWHLATTGAFPDYFGLIGATSESDALPAAYFERGSPTPAHRVIAALAGAGIAGPILTTNLDGLLEQALAAAGVAFMTASDLDSLRDVDLVGCALIKLHGDYRDASLRHASPGLHKYPPVVDAFLGRVFEAFDLLVCGWSASWDLPLGRAIEAAGSGRQVYWLQCGPATPNAQAIFSARRACVATVESSDAGLSQLAELLLGTDPGPGYSRRPLRERGAESTRRGVPGHG
jgi:hypothetical protein